MQADNVALCLQGRKVDLGDMVLAEDLPVYAFAREALIGVPQPFDLRPGLLTSKATNNQKAT